MGGNLAVFVLTLAALFISESLAATFTFRNNCPFTVWPGVLTGGGQAQLPSTGFELAPQATFALDAPAPWSGRIWGRTGCGTDGSGKFSCATADCGSGTVACSGAGAIPPATLVELTIAPNAGQDFYDTSLVDGFNLPISLTPQGAAGCSSTSCPANVNSACPPELAVRGADGSIVACKSACLAFEAPQYCCTGAYSSPATCPPTDYSRVFKNQCPQSYSYAYDDKSSTFTCTGGPNYAVTFCP